MKMKKEKENPNGPVDFVTRTQLSRAEATNDPSLPHLVLSSPYLSERERFFVDPCPFFQVDIGLTM
jgi:hypothetical protein